MAYTALKPCRFAGQSFKVGESVPAAMLLPGAAKNLVKMGIVAETNESTPTPPPEEPTINPESIQITVRVEEGDMSLDVTKEGIQAVFDALTSNVAEAEAIVNQITDLDALILLDVADKRKSIGELAKARAEALIPEEIPENEGE